MCKSFFVFFLFACLAARALALAISGGVFLDADGDGNRGAGENGLPDVAVSDGVRITRSDAHGRYTIKDSDPAKNPFVFVVTPSGFRRSGAWYFRLPLEAGSLTADFALAPAPETSNSDFTFAHFTDTHVDKSYKDQAADAREVAALKPAFAMNTGDLVASPDRAWYENYILFLADAAEAGLYIHNIIAGHDAPGQDWSLYEEFLGPTYYSFDCGESHFVVLNCLGRLPQQYEWLEADLELQPPNRPVFAFQHNPIPYDPAHPLYAILAARPLSAIFTGHWHSTKTLPGDRSLPVIYVNTPALYIGGIDASPRGFRLASIKDGKLLLDNRLGNVKGHCALVAPADGDTVPPGALTIRAAAYDVTASRTMVEFRLDDGQWTPMSAAGKLSWETVAAVSEGSHSMVVRAVFDEAPPVEQRATFMVAGAPPSVRQGEDWPQFQRNAARTGSTDIEVRPPLRLAWSTALGGMTHVASPVYAGGLVYMGVADEELTGKAGVYALDAGTGELKWRFPTGTSIRNSVAVDNGRVFAVTIEGTVFALNAADGTECWNYRLGPGTDRWVYNSPAVHEGVVYAGTAPVFVALDAADGGKLWQAQPMGGDWISCLSSPAVGKDMVFAASYWGQGFFALEKKNGDPLWQKKQGFNSFDATPAYDNGIVYANADGILRAIDVETGMEEWKHSVNNWVISSPALSSFSIEEFVVIGAHFGRVHAVDRATGDLRWEFKVGKALFGATPYTRDSNALVGSPVIAGEVVYIGAPDGRLYALELTTGKALWSYYLGAPVFSTPAISGNMVYVSVHDGVVFAFAGEE